MVILGLDAHKRSHTVVAVDGNGRQLGVRTVGATSADHLGLLRWADRFGAVRQWAVEDCRHLSRRLERDLFGAGERIVRVPPKLMAHVRNSASTARTVRCGCSPTTATRWSPSAPAPSSSASPAPRGWSPGWPVPCSTGCEV